MRKYGHVDGFHILGNPLRARGARGGVADAVDAEKGDDVSSGDDLDALARADRATAMSSTTKKRPNEAEKPASKRKTARVIDSHSDEDVDDKAAEADDISENEDDGDDEKEDEQKVKIDQLQAEHAAKQHNRRGKDKKERTKKSVWFLCGTSHIDSEKKYRHLLCVRRVVLNKNGSSSNMKGHYEANHRQLYDRTCVGIEEKTNTDVMTKLFTDAQMGRGRAQRRCV
jgi:hypothetical protein